MTAFLGGWWRIYMSGVGFGEERERKGCSGGLPSQGFALNPPATFHFGLAWHLLCSTPRSCRSCFFFSVGFLIFLSAVYISALKVASFSFFVPAGGECRARIHDLGSRFAEAPL